ncbi:MAG: hypothetical protein V3T58_07160 [Candidatus Hydrothermarchaeales archaeon]
MWSELETYFKKFPAQKRVAILLLRRGLRIKNGKVLCGKLEIPHTQIAKELGVDRRVVDATTTRILENKKLGEVYSKLQPIAFLRESAPAMGLNVIVITADDASKPGIIGSITSRIAEHRISIRQALAEDPYLLESPELTVITEGEIPGELINELRKIEGVKKVTIY